MKTKLKFTLFDAVIVLLVLALLGGIVVKLNLRQSDDSAGTGTDSEPCAVCYTLKVSSVRELYGYALEVGDTLFYDNAAIGEIVSVTKEPAVCYEGAADGQFIAYSYTNRYDLYITVSATCTNTASGYTVGEYTLLLGKEDTFFTKYAAYTATVLRIAAE